MEFLQVELGDLRTRLGKVQDETKGMAGEKEMALAEGTREWLLIMERIECLSQLYLGGLEDVRQDMCDVNHSCNKRVDKVESQWDSLKRHREVACEDSGSSLPRQVTNYISTMMITLNTEHFLLHQFYCFNI